MILGYAHGATDQRTIFIYTTAPVALQSWTWQRIESFDECIQLLIRPAINEWIPTQARSRKAQLTDLLHCCVHDPLPLFRRKRLQTVLDFLPIEKRHRKKTDTAVGTASATGKSIEERSLGPFKPSGSLFK